MRPDKFTAKFQQALAEAQSLAIGRDQAMIEPAHLLLARGAQLDRPCHLGGGYRAGKLGARALGPRPNARHVPQRPGRRDRGRSGRRPPPRRADRLHRRHRHGRLR